MTNYTCANCSDLCMEKKDRSCLVYNCKLGFFEPRIDLPKKVPEKCYMDESYKRR